MYLGRRDRFDEGPMTIPDAGETQGAFLKRLRSMRDLTQRDVAEGARVSVRTVMRAENGHSVEWDNLMSICSVLQVDARQVPSSLAAAPEAVDAGDELEPEMSLETASETHVPVTSKTSRAKALLFHGCAMALVATVVLGSVSFLTADAEALRRDVSLVGQARLATDMAQRVNAIANDLATNAVKERLDLTVTLAGQSRYSFCNIECMDLVVGNGVAQLDDGSVLVTLGPLSRTTYTAIVPLLTRDLRVKMEMAITPTYRPTQRGTLWVDARGVRTNQLPNFDDEDYLQVRIRR
jgi:transcriptional regulator with XRE-family HTH domain